MIVNICGVPHKVIEVTEIEKGDPKRIMGDITYADAEIRILKSMPPKLKRQTIIHEMVHGMLFHIGETKLCSDEGFVQRLAMAISQSFEIVEKQK